MEAKDHQPGPIAPLPRFKRASGQCKVARLKSQQWEIKTLLTRGGLDGDGSTKSSGLVHGCPGVSLGMLGDCRESLS